MSQYRWFHNRFLWEDLISSETLVRTQLSHIYPIFCCSALVVKQLRSDFICQRFGCKDYVFGTSILNDRIWGSSGGQYEVFCLLWDAVYSGRNLLTVWKSLLQCSDLETERIRFPAVCKCLPDCKASHPSSFRLKIQAVPDFRHNLLLKYVYESRNVRKYSNRLMCNNWGFCSHFLKSI
jgi:hypothetical protein